MSRPFNTLLATTAAIVLFGAGAAWADDQPAAAPAAAPAPPASWSSTVKVSGHVDVGIIFNGADPANGINFGQPFTDHANRPNLNQVALTVERDLDPKATGVDFGFKVQGMYGSDSRLTHFFGELDNSPKGREQFDIVEANLQAHLPFLTKGGIDVKLGQFSTPLGEEVIDPTGNFFYSHSYLFQFGLPYKHTGILTTTHVSPMLDVYLGYTTGVNTTVGSGGGDNDGQFHFLGGIGLNLNKLTVLALTHIGPENPYGSLGVGVNVHSKYRYLTDVLFTYKVNAKLTSVTEFNYIRDDGFAASGGGVVQYFTYAINDQTSVGVRAEVWRDAQGFYVAAFPGFQDAINLQKGLPNTAYGAGPATYGAITLGANFKPPHLPKLIDGLTIRPEIRYDRALAGGTPFNGNPGTSKDQFTFGVDLVAPLTF